MYEVYVCIAQYDKLLGSCWVRFPMETTVCVSRLIVTGVLDDVPKLR